jgi:hypothetical protein
MMTKNKFEIDKDSYGRGAKLNMVSMDQMSNEQILEEVPLEELQRTMGRLRKWSSPKNHIFGILVKYKDVLTN